MTGSKIDYDYFPRSSEDLSFRYGGVQEDEGKYSWSISFHRTAYRREYNMVY
jgi:hypothetical protein